MGAILILDQLNHQFLTDMKHPGKTTWMNSLLINYVDDESMKRLIGMMIKLPPK